MPYEMPFDDIRAFCVDEIRRKGYRYHMIVHTDAEGARDCILDINILGAILALLNSAERLTGAYDGMNADLVDLTTKPPTKVSLPCKNCGKLQSFSLSSEKANGVFNVFCKNGTCEDRYAFNH